MIHSLILAAFAFVAAPTFEVQTLDGQTLVGPLKELNTERVTVDVGSRRVSLETERLLSINAASPQYGKEAKADGNHTAPAVGVPPRKGPGPNAPNGDRATARPGTTVVTLLDGSTIFAKQYVSHGAKAKITPFDGPVLEIPTKGINTVQLQQDSAASNAEWTRLLSQKSDGDLLVVRKDQTIDYHKGVLHDVTDDIVQFDLDGDVLPVKRSKVYGFVYHRGAGDRTATAVCRITDASGSQWAARTLALTDKLQWTTPTGATIAESLDRIRQIDFSGGKIVFLSDLKPDSQQWTPYFKASKMPESAAKFYLPRMDRGFEPGPLQLGGVQYRKGLAMYGRTEVVYRLPDGFTRFRAMAGIADAVRPGGKTRLIVRGDEKDLLQASLNGKDAPRPVDVDVTGVRRLTIVVDFDGVFAPGDYLLLCNARLSK